MAVQPNRGILFHSTALFRAIELTFINVKLYMSWVWCDLWSDPFDELGYGVIMNVEILIGLLLTSSDWFLFKCRSIPFRPI